MNVRLLVFAIGCLLMVSASAQGVRFNMTPAQVEAEIGKPSSSMSRGDRSVWMYPGDGRVEFLNGRAVDIRNLTIDTSGSPIEPAETLSETVPAETTGVAVTDPEAAAPDEVASMLESEQSPYAGALPEAFSADDEEDLEWDEEAYEYEEPSTWQVMMGIGIEALLTMIVTMLVLKAAFKWSDIHADWSQMILPSVADVSTKTGVVLFAELVLDTSSVFHLDYALSYLALVIVLMKATHASTLHRAVQVAAAAKVASIVVWALLSVFLLQMAFG